MEEIYVNFEHDKCVYSRPSTNQTGPSSAERRCYGGVVVCLGLLSVFLMAGLIGLGIFSAGLSAAKANLTEHLQASNNQMSSMTAERDQLNASLIAKTVALQQLQSLSKRKKTCPIGWRMFSCSCYLLSTQPDSWDKGRKDCRHRGADLVVIDSRDEETFIIGFTKNPTWIGLSDKETEGTWRWIDGTPLTFKNWETNQPDNGGGSSRWGEEDCVHIRNKDNTLWNDLSCAALLPWVCEKIAQH